MRKLLSAIIVSLFMTFSAQATMIYITADFTFENAADAAIFGYTDTLDGTILASIDYNDNMSYANTWKTGSSANYGGHFSGYYAYNSFNWEVGNRQWSWGYRNYDTNTSHYLKVTNSNLSTRPDAVSLGGSYQGPTFDGAYVHLGLFDFSSNTNPVSNSDTVGVWDIINTSNIRTGWFYVQNFGNHDRPLSNIQVSLTNPQEAEVLPEPESLFLLGLGLTAVGVGARRRRQ